MKNECLVIEYNNRCYYIPLYSLDKYFCIAPFTWYVKLYLTETKVNEANKTNKQNNNYLPFHYYLLIMLMVYISKKIDIPLYELEPLKSVALTAFLYFVVFCFMHFKNRFLYHCNNKLESLHSITLTFVPNRKYYVFCLKYICFQIFALFAVYLFFIHISIIHSFVGVGMLVLLYELQHHHWRQYELTECGFIVIQENDGK